MNKQKLYKYILLVVVIHIAIACYAKKQSEVYILCDTLDYTKTVLQQFNLTKETASKVTTVYILNYNDNTLPITVSDFPNLLQLFITSPTIFDLKGISDFQKLECLKISRILNSRPMNIFNVSEIWSLKNLKKLTLNIPIKEHIGDSIIKLRKLEELSLNIGQPIFGILKKVSYIKKISLPNYYRRWTMFPNYEHFNSEFDISFGFDTDLYFDKYLCETILKIPTKYGDRDKQMIKKIKFNCKNTNDGLFTFCSDNYSIIGNFKNGLPDGIWIYTYDSKKLIRNFVNGESNEYEYTVTHRNFKKCSNTINKSFLLLKKIDDSQTKQLVYKYDKKNDKSYIRFFDYDKMFIGSNGEICHIEKAEDSEYKDEWVIDFKNHYCYRKDTNDLCQIIYYGSFIGCNKVINDCYDLILNGENDYLIVPYYDNYIKTEHQTLCRECLKQFSKSDDTDSKKEFEQLKNQIIYP